MVALKYPTCISPQNAFCQSDSTAIASGKQATNVQETTIALLASVAVRRSYVTDEALSSSKRKEWTWFDRFILK